MRCKSLIVAFLLASLTPHISKGESPNSPEEKIAALNEKGKELDERREVLLKEADELKEIFSAAERERDKARADLDARLESYRNKTVEAEALPPFVQSFCDADSRYSNAWTKVRLNELNLMGLQSDISAHRNLVLIEELRSLSQELRNTQQERDKKNNQLLDQAGEMFSHFDQVRKAVMQLVIALDDEDPRVQKLAMDLIIPLGSYAKDAIPKLETLTNSSDETLRATAKKVLAAIEAEEE